MRDTVFPASQRKPGFYGFLLMSDRQTSKVIGITLWESEAAMLASEEEEYLQEQVSRVIPGLRRPPEFENYEIEVLWFFRLRLLMQNETFQALRLCTTNRF
jgi:quinol monooxygenase YgiN